MPDHPTASAGRPLTADEAHLVRWMLEHGEPEAASFLPAVDTLRVVGGCPCGCASLDFLEPKTGAMRILADFGLRPQGEPPGGIFLFAYDGKLAGIDVYSYGDPVARLPAPEELVPLPPA